MTIDDLIERVCQIVGPPPERYDIEALLCLANEVKKLRKEVNQLKTKQE